MPSMNRRIAASDNVVTAGASRDARPGGVARDAAWQRRPVDNRYDGGPADPALEARNAIGGSRGGGLADNDITAWSVQVELLEIVPPPPR
jgi:hypothetical protein